MVTETVYTNEYPYVTRREGVGLISKQDLVWVEALTRCEGSPTKLLDQEAAVLVLTKAKDGWWYPQLIKKKGWAIWRDDAKAGITKRNGGDAYPCPVMLFKPTLHEADSSLEDFLALRTEDRTRKR